IGMDGHIAYNEPGSSFTGGSHVVTLQEESRKSSLDYGFDRIEDVPFEGVSQGIGTIMQAKQLIMIAKGSKKAKLVKRMIEGEVNENFPSSIIQRHHNVIVVLDKDAAKELEEKK
ncbi:MAG: 6-phosphogluconolactonase, partial [Faecalibacillus sp.]